MGIFLFQFSVCFVGICHLLCSGMLRDQCPLCPLEMYLTPIVTAFRRDEFPNQSGITLEAETLNFPTMWGCFL